MKVNKIEFPEFSGIRCLMMPYIQGDIESVPDKFKEGYAEIIKEVYLKKGSIGYLTIDESLAKKGLPHRGKRAKSKRALHTEAGIRPNKIYAWGHSGWGRDHNVELDKDVEVLLANSLDNSCALWDATHEDTTTDGDIGHLSYMYPISEALLMKAGDVHKIGILTPHESLPVMNNVNRQFLRIVSSGVHGRESYFTRNPVIGL